MSALRRLKGEAAALLVMVAAFVLFFWPVTLRGQLLLTADALVYSYPLRQAAFAGLRHGSLPLWTPHLLSGYPLLSMAQLALGYPLTWAYLVLPGYRAEQVYVLAPYLLTPFFTYAYLRQVGRSRAAALLGGLGFVYGGIMVSSLGHNGMSTNALTWLPLMLLAIERARAGRLALGLVGMTGAYAMALLGGSAQAFVYMGALALAYAAFVSWEGRTGKPLLAAAGGMALAAGVAAFQILEGLQAHRLSIRSRLSYEIFTDGGLSPLQALKALLWPNEHLGNEAPYGPLLAVGLAGLAVVAGLRRRDRRSLFWAGLALLTWLLMLGAHTPLGRLTYLVPVLNLFRAPQRHAFEWSFAIAVLGAAGLDELRAFVSRGATPPRPRDGWIAGALLAGVVAAGLAWAISPGRWLPGKLLFLSSALAAICWCSRFRRAPGAGAALALSVAGACVLEGFLLVSSWWFPDARPAGYFQTVAPSTRFLQAWPPEHNRIYTSVTDYRSLDQALSAQHNLSALYGFHDAGGYEPLMLERYNRAFVGRWAFQTPWFGAPLDAQILSPRWQVLDLLNVRFLVDFSAPSSRMEERFGVPFPQRDLPVLLQPGASASYTGGAGAFDSLSLVSALAHSSALAQGEVFARLTVHTEDGRTVERALRAGLDAAEWAHEHPAVRATMKHGLAPIFDQRPGTDGLPALRYWTRLGLGEKVAVERVELHNTSPAFWAIDKVALFDSSGHSLHHRATMLTRRLPDHWRKVHDQDDVAIYENPRVLPRVWLTAHAEAAGAEEALLRIRGEGAPFDPRTTALLEVPPERLPSLPPGELAPEAAGIAAYEPNRVVIDTGAERPAVLVASEISYPGWRATIDGRPAELLTADYLLRALVVPAGAHRVEMRYTAPAARTGAIVSLCSLLLLLGLAVAHRIRRP